MEQLRIRRGFAHRYAVPGLVVLVVIGSALLVAQPWTTWCPTDWGNASRVDLSGSSGDVILEGRPYRVGGNALLDYMPRALSTPIDQVLYRLRGEHHPLTVVATVSASSRDALGDPAFTCFRVTRGREIWSRRPTTYPTQTSADGLPPGAPVPSSVEAWRLAVANDGPEWPDDGQISVELWVNVNGGHYLFVLPPMALMRGG